MWEAFGCVRNRILPYYTGAGHIIRISSKSLFISLIPLKKWNLYNVYIHSTQTDIFQVFISFNFDDYNWQLMKTPNSVSQKIRILLKTNTKKGFFYTGHQETWILCLSSLPPDSGTLISKGNAKFTFIREHNFGPLSSSPVLFVFSPGETLLTLSVVQEWLDTRNATAETHVLHTSVRSGSWSTDSSCSPLFVNLPHIFEWVLFHNPLQGVVIPIACTLFSTTSFPSLRLSINVLGHRALWTASLFCNDLLCLALLVKGVNSRLLDNCQVSSLPHDCVAYRTRLRDHLKAFAGVLS